MNGLVRREYAWPGGSLDSPDKRARKACRYRLPAWAGLQARKELRNLRSLSANRPSWKPFPRRERLRVASRSRGTWRGVDQASLVDRGEEHTAELQSRR